MSSSLPQVRGVGTQTILNFSGTNCPYEKWWADDVRIPRAKIARTEFEREKFNFSNMRSLSPLFPPCSPGLVDNAPPVTDIIIVVVKIYTYRGKRTFCVNNIRTKRIGGIASSRFRSFGTDFRTTGARFLPFGQCPPTPCHCYPARGRRGPSARVLLKRLCVSATATMRIRRARHPLASGVALRSRSLVFGSNPSAGAG